MEAMATRSTWISVICAAAFGALLVSTGCTTSAPGDRSAGRLEGGFLGLQGGNHAFWEEWTPRAPTAMSPGAPLTPSTVFDVWRLGESDYRNGVWDATFHVVSALNTAVDDPVLTRGIESVLLRADPAVDDAVWELAFLSHETGEAEGIVLRIASSDGAGLWIEASRPTDGEDSPNRWTLRIEPAVEETEGLTAVWNREGGDWSVGLAAGSDAGEDQLEPVEPPGGQRLVEMWTEAVWQPVTGRTYVEPEFEPIADPGEPLAEGWPPALGREVRERGLEDFVTDTVFIP